MFAKTSLEVASSNSVELHQEFSKVCKFLKVKFNLNQDGIKRDITYEQLKNLIENYPDRFMTILLRYN